MTVPNLQYHLAWTKYAHECFWWGRISRTFWCGPNVSMDSLDRTKCLLISIKEQKNRGSYLVCLAQSQYCSISSNSPKKKKWAKRTYCFYTFVFWNKWHYFPGDLIHYSLNLAILLLALCILRRYPFQSKISKGFSG